MGTWDHGSFDNDSALDWVCDLTTQKKSWFRKRPDPFKLIASTINTVLNETDRLDPDDECNAIAAAECVAAANGHPANELPEEVETWLQSIENQRPPKSLIDDALRAVQISRNDERSDLRMLKAESNNNTPPQEWLASIDDLINRLG